MTTVRASELGHVKVTQPVKVRLEGGGFGVIGIGIYELVRENTNQDIAIRSNPFGPKYIIALGFRRSGVERLPS